MKIKVEQSDIDNGLLRNCYRCPVALAACRAFNVEINDSSLFKPFLLVTATAISMYDGIGRMTKSYLLPIKVIDFIILFDCDFPIDPTKYPPEPFEFEVNEEVEENDN